MNDPDKSWLRSNLLARFLRYVKIDTMSDPAVKTRPTTPGQLELAQCLISELENLGITDLCLEQGCFLIARIPPRGSVNPHYTGFMAHLDTSSEVTARGVTPLLHEDYQGTTLALNDSVKLDPVEFPDLKRFTGDTLITTNGDTLLGADDKAGIAEIMAALEYLKLHPELNHPGLEIIFTTDEETGRGMDNFPISSLKSCFCYTMDGSGDGVIETENFEAYKVTVNLQGRSFHLGKAYGKLINSLQLVNSLLNMLPDTEKPETTAGRQGYYCPIDVTGTLEHTQVHFLIRDFDEDVCKRRIAVLQTIAAALEKSYPGARVEVKSEKQYANMRRFIKPAAPGILLLEQAIRRTGIEPVYNSIRGGTDGSRLSEMGIPAPNIFSGGFNFHSRYEWIPVSAMVRAASVIINLAGLWAGLA